MKTFFVFCCMLFFLSCVTGKENTYTGSTPADTHVRSFLGMPLQDSVDFIRWQLVISGNSYKLYCNYGIGKPNTNGFINGGKMIDLSGACKKERNQYKLHHDNKILNLLEINKDLLQLTGEDDELLVGNAGWSYTLNSTMPVHTDAVSTNSEPMIIKDSLVFEGRTPCDVPGIIPAGKECYKLKWHIALYANAQKHGSGTYRVFGNIWHKPGRTGPWELKEAKDGRIIYQLYDEKGNEFVRLVKLDDNILAFTDALGKLLVGNEDFSYTMNRIEKQ
jgi:hypothetical protein